MSKYLIGIDNGGTMSKAAIYDLSGKELAVSGYKTKMIVPEPGFIERDMEEMWQANVNAIRDIIKMSKVNPTDIAGIATTGHGNGMYLIDSNGNPAYNAIISNDTRAKDYVTKWYSDGTFEKVLPKTMQSIWAGQPVALISWFKDNKPEVIKRTKWVLMCKDYIRFRLTGNANAEITDMSGTNLMNVRDVKYDKDLLKEFGLEDILEKLPPIKYSSEVCGYVTKEAAEATGLAEGTPVAGGLFDLDSSAIATGITKEDMFCIVAGTWSINEYISKKPVVSKDLFMTSLYCMKNHWLITEGSATSASNLDWFVTQFMGEEAAKGKQENKSVFDYANEMVESTNPKDSNIVFLPFLFGTNVDADAKACFVGLNGWHTKAGLLRAVYEGVVFGHKAHIDKLFAFREKPKAIRIAGGAAKSKVWVQIFADVLQIPIEVTATTELGALGAAICAGISTNNFKSFDSAADSMVKIKYTCKPNPELKDVYNKKYNIYNQTIQALTPVFKKL